MAYADYEGSPPRMRGKDAAMLSSGIVRRITPAYAGKSVWQRLPLAQARDHPRICGEKGCILPKNASLMGSPPRMRGKGGRLRRLK